MRVGRMVIASFVVATVATSIACGARTSLAVGTTVEVEAGADVRARDAVADRVDASTRPPLPTPRAIFATTSDFDFRDRLYRFDPKAAKLTLIAKIKGCNDVADIAIDRKGRAFVTTRAGFARLDLDTGDCTLVAAGSFPHALEALPPNVVGPDEAIVGFRLSEYVRVDATTGALSVTSTLPFPAWAGDVTYLEGRGLVAALYTSDPEHLLFPVDPKDGTPAEPIAIGGEVVDFTGTAPWGWTLYAFGGIAGIYAIDTFGPAWTSAPVDYEVQGGGDPLLPFTGAAPLW